MVSVHGGVGKAVAPRRLGVMPRIKPKNPSSCAEPRIRCRPRPRSAVNIDNARTPRRQVQPDVLITAPRTSGQRGSPGRLSRPMRRAARKTLTVQHVCRNESSVLRGHRRPSIRIEHCQKAAWSRVCWQGGNPPPLTGRSASSVGLSKRVVTRFAPASSFWLVRVFRLRLISLLR